MIDDEVDETRLVPVERLPQYDPTAGMAALSEMSQAEFERRLEAMRRGRERLATIHRELMKEGDDYGVIPGTAKPTLLKPGAEKLASLYRLASEFKHTISYGASPEEPTITVVAECLLHLGSLAGPVVNTGHGAANSFERRYRYRRGERACPECGMIGSIIKGKKEWGGGWKCWDKKGGCGAKFGEDVPAIVNQVVGDVENPDPFDLLNTLLKMASKRAFVDSVLRATATSSIFTQDMEEVQPSAVSRPPSDPKPETRYPIPDTGTDSREAEEDPFAGDDTPRTPRAVNQTREDRGKLGPESAGCEECGVALTAGQTLVSRRRYSRALCPIHQKDAVVTTDIA